MTLPRLKFTQIPNVILDQWILKLSPAEFKLLLFICRKTYGWNKEEDFISVSQMEKGTGLSRFGITKCLRQLKKYMLVKAVKTKEENGGNGPSIYQVNLEAQIPEDIICNTVDTEGACNNVSYPHATIMHTSIGDGVYNTVDPQKTPISFKDTNTKDMSGEFPPDPPKSSAKALDVTDEAKEMTEYFWTRLSTLFPKLTKPNFINWAADLDKMKKKYKLSWEEIRGVIDWVYDHKWWYKNIRCPSKLSVQYETLYMQMTNVPNKGTMEQKNYEFAKEVKAYLISNNIKNNFQILGDNCYIGETNQYIIYNMNPDAFTEILCKAYGLRRT